MNKSKFTKAARFNFICSQRKRFEKKMKMMPGSKIKNLLQFYEWIAVFMGWFVVISLVIIFYLLIFQGI